jgi:hypothetical protein
MRPSGKAFAEPGDTWRVAALLDREQALLEKARHLGEASYRQRCTIEQELADIRRLLEHLGLRSPTDD